MTTRALNVTAEQLALLRRLVQAQRQRTLQALSEMDIRVEQDPDSIFSGPWRARMRDMRDDLAGLLDLIDNT